MPRRPWALKSSLPILMPILCQLSCCSAPSLRRGVEAEKAAQLTTAAPQ